MASDFSVNPWLGIDYNKFAKTLSGRAWLEKALHPPGAALAPVAGMPDNDSFPSTTMEFRNTDTVVTPLATDPTWSALFLVMPSPEIPAMVWKWSSSQPAPDMSNWQNGTRIVNNNYTFANWDTDVSRWRRLYGSATFELNAATLADQGMVYCAQQRMEQLPGGTAFVPGAEFVAMPEDNIVNEFLPTLPSQILQVSPRFYKQRAKEGCFTVSGLVQPINLYRAGTGVPVFMGTTAQYRGGHASLYQITSRVGSWNGQSIGVQAGIHDNWSSSWVLFTGIASSATIELKNIHGYEIQAALGSGFTLFSEPPAEPDVDAVNAYYSLRHGQADGYPASFNFFGSLLAALPSILPKVPAFFQGLSNVASSVIPALTGMFGGGGESTTAKVDSVTQVAKPVPAPRRRPVVPIAAPRTVLPTVPMSQQLRDIESRMANLEVAPQPRTRLIPVPAPRRPRQRVIVGLASGRRQRPRVARRRRTLYAVA